MLALLLGMSALFLFVDRRTPPIILWDESRLAVNALEMHLRGMGLVTTYGFAPDLWNTKPPLAIWLMALSADLFGPSELALRLPSMLAGLATLAIVFAFVRRVTRRTWPAAVALLLLAASVGFYGEHGARTGDYDALLCLFTTGYLCLFFEVVHRRRPSWRWLLAAAAMVAAATLTKSIAGLFPGIGVALYLLVSGRLRRVAGDPRTPVALLLALVPLAVFYVAREAAAPGYLDAAWYNDGMGRSARALDGHRGPPWYYLEQVLLLNGVFAAGPLALLALRGPWIARGRARAALVFALCCIAGTLLPLSLSATKLVHYALPALPWLAIACALTLDAAMPGLMRRMRAASAPVRTLLILLGLLALGNIAVRAALVRYTLLPERQFFPQAGYGAVLAALHARGTERVTLVDPGFDVEGIRHYAPQLDFHAERWRSRGMQIERRLTLPARPSTVTASCDPGVVQAMTTQGGAAFGFPGCAMRTLSPVRRAVP